MTDFSQDTQTGNGEVRIGDHWYPVLGGVSEQPLARWPPKVTFGDYSQDSDPLVSAYVMSSFTGGIGNWKIKAGVEDDTYWTGTLETRYAEGATLLPLTESFGSDNAEYDEVMPLGDFPASDPQFLVAFDGDLHSWDETGQGFDFESALSAEPVYRGVEFDDLFWIPMGSAGYDTLDNALAVTGSVLINPIQFIVWDNKLMALTVEGHLRQWDVNAGDWSDTEWATSGENRTLPSGVLPRRLVNFINQSGVPTLYVITNTIAYAYDPDGLRLYETKLDYPKHPDQGRAAANWRGDTMFVNVGLGIHGYNGSLITSMGPDGRFGLPAHLRGTIVDLMPEYNALFALISGKPVPEATITSEEFIVQAPMYGNEDTWQISDFPYAPVYSSIYRWSNSQWHPVWESNNPEGGTPTLMALSEAGNSYRLWWGYGNMMYTQALPVDFQNPKQSLLSQSMEFMPTGQLITGWFDADMTAFYKLASHVEVNLDDADGNQHVGGTVRIEYMIDQDTAWRSLGTATIIGRTNMTFGNVAKTVGDAFSKGRPFRRIRFRIVMTQAPGETRLSPVLESLVFKFHKIPEQSLSWQFSVNLTNREGYKGIGNDDLAQYLYDQLVSTEFFEFGYLNNVYRVRAAQATGDRSTGYDERGNYQVALVEVTEGPERQPYVTIRQDTW